MGIKRLSLLASAAERQWYRYIFEPRSFLSITQNNWIAPFVQEDSRFRISGFLLIAAFSLYLAGCQANESEHLVEATCPPQRISIEEGSAQQFQTCMLREFGSGTDLARLRQYLDGAGFYGWSAQSVDGNVFEEWIWLQNDGKHTKKKRLVFSYNPETGKIVSIKADEWRMMDGPDIFTGN